MDSGGPAAFRPRIWVRSEPSGKVFLTVGKSEMEQGVRTSLPTIFAEELAAPTGMGAQPVPVTAAAVVNALSSASGRRLRRLPLRAEDFRGT